MILDKLPNNFYSVEDITIRLQKHTAKQPIFDLQQAIDDLDYWQVARNARLGVMAKNKETGEYYRIGSIYAVIPGTRDLENLKYEVKAAYKRVSGKTVEPEKKVRTVTTKVDDLESLDPQPRAERKDKTKYGEKMKSGKLTNQQMDGQA